MFGGPSKLSAVWFGHPSLLSWGDASAQRTQCRLCLLSKLAVVLSAASMQQVGFAGVQGVPMDHTVAQVSHLHLYLFMKSHWACQAMTSVQPANLRSE